MMRVDADFTVPMNTLMTAPRRLARRLLPGRRKREAVLDALPFFAVPAEAIAKLDDAVAFRQQLLALIAAATRRIVIVTLYLQDDEAGREVMEALYAAKARHPALEISVFVDWHRAQRGLIGKDKSAGNAGMYREYAERLGPGVDIYGVPVQTREIFGVLHVKGFIVDDTVLYSGASLNDIYLARHGRYRLDRYHRLAACSAGRCHGGLRAVAFHRQRGCAAAQRRCRRPRPNRCSRRSANSASCCSRRTTRCRSMRSAPPTWR